MNIINAIINFIQYQNIEIKDIAANNKIISVGNGLEQYIKDLFADSFNVSGVEALKKYERIFSYLGNQTNPPDLMLRNGDIIEIKKLQKPSEIPLNSSMPKSKLFVTDPMINSSCKNAEQWEEKDYIYSIGCVANNQLQNLCFIYGSCYAADISIYERIKTKIKSGIEEISGVEFSKTKEIGRVNKVDPLGITYLRLRGMWHIEHPFKVFSYLLNPKEKLPFLMAIIPKKKKNMKLFKIL